VWVYKLLCLHASLVCLLVGCTSSAQPPQAHGPEPSSVQLRLASASYPPYVDTADHPRAALDLVATALARAGYIAKNEIVPLDAVVEGLRADKYDGSAALWQSEEREQFLLYSDALLENRLLLVGQKGSDVSAASLSELKAKKVGIVTDYAYGPELDQAKEPVFVRGTSTEDNLRALLRGELDYVIADALVVHHLQQQFPQQTREKLSAGSKPLIKRTLHFAVRKSFPGAPGIIENFNRQLATMLADGSYNDALHVDWVLADIDKDGTAELVAVGDRLGADPPGSGYRPMGPEGGATPARFVVKGVAYDSWQAVPDEYKTPSQAHSDKPGTLRASVFEF